MLVLFTYPGLNLFNDLIYLPFSSFNLTCSIQHDWDNNQSTVACSLIEMSLMLNFYLYVKHFVDQINETKSFRISYPSYLSSYYKDKRTLFLFCYLYMLESLLIYILVHFS